MLKPKTTTTTLTAPNPSNSRRAFVASVFAAAATCATTPAHAVLDIPEQKSYSTNARNLDRLNAGDRSGGSSYDNNPATPAAAKRRALQGCKVPAARRKAKVKDEKTCNQRVLGGNVEFMLETLRELDCPTCPYGIQGA